MTEGVELSQSYVTPKCSPSRASLLTGVYPWKLGMQRGAVERFQPDGLNTSYKLLPELLKEANYSTHAVRNTHEILPDLIRDVRLENGTLATVTRTIFHKTEDLMIFLASGVMQQIITHGMHKKV